MEVLRLQYKNHALLIPPNKSAGSQQWETGNQPSDLNEACLAAKGSLIRTAQAGHEIQADAQDSQDREGSAGAGQDIAERTGEERRDERDRAARLLGMVPSWGVKRHNRYLKEGIAGLQTRPRSGCPSRISSKTLKAVKKK